MAPGVSIENEDEDPTITETRANWRPIQPNMLVTGTPGVGKSSFAERLSEELSLRHIDVGYFARERNLLGDHNALHEAFYMDEEAVLDELEPIMASGAAILDHHSCDWYPERWIQLVIVLRARTEVLYDRLESRGYSQAKLGENMEAEIMQVVYEEAVNSYPNVPVLELRSDSEGDIERNLETVRRKWREVAEGFEGYTAPSSPRARRRRTQELSRPARA